MFAGSDRGGERAAAVYTLIATAKLNDIDPQAWLEDVLRRIADHPAGRLTELLPWNWRLQVVDDAAAGNPARRGLRPDGYGECARSRRAAYEVRLRDRGR